MAEKLQKTLTVQPTVASLGQPLPPDTSTAQLLGTALDAVGSFVSKSKRAEITEEIEDLGKDVFAVNTQKELAEKTDRIRRLEQGRVQGKVSETMVKIEAEKLIKEVSSNNPIIADEITREAARILGFDPTGAEIKSLFGLDAPTRGAPTLGEKFQANAESLAPILNVSTESLVTIQAQAWAAKQRADLATEQAKLGGTDRVGIFNATLGEINGDIADINAELLSMVKQEGVLNPQAALAVIQSVKDQRIKALHDRYRAANINPSEAEISQGIAVINSRFENIEAISQDASVMNILAEKSGTLAELSKIEVYDKYGPIKAANDAGGQVWVEHFIKHMDALRSGSADGQIRLNEALDPSLKVFGETLDQLVVNMSDSYERVLGRKPTFASTLSVDMLDVSSHKISGAETQDEGLRNSRLAFAHERGAPYKDFSDYFRPGIVAVATEREKSFVKARFDNEFPKLVASIAAQLEANPEVELSVDQSGRVQAVNVGQEEVFVGKGLGRVSSQASVPLSLKQDVQRLNVFQKGMQSGWAPILEVDAANFMERQVNEISSVRASEEASRNVQEARDAFRVNPTPENLERIRAVDPDLAKLIDEELANIRGGGSEDGE